MMRDELARGLLGDAVHAYEAALGERLVAAYALGSLAHGGFSPLVSDLDLGLVLRDPPLAGDRPAIERVAAGLAAIDPDRHGRLSVFWGTRASLSGQGGDGRFPPVDRLDLLRDGLLLSGEDTREGLPEPRRSDLLAGGAEFALALLAGDETLALLHRPELLPAHGTQRLTKLVLFPVRFLYTAETGLVGANAAAAARHVQACRPGSELVARALAWRAAEPPGDEAPELLVRDLLPLYRGFIHDHRLRLDAIGRHDLAAAFAEWGRRLAARPS